MVSFIGLDFYTLNYTVQSYTVKVSVSKQRHDMGCLFKSFFDGPNGSGKQQAPSYIVSKFRFPQCPDFAALPISSCCSCLLSVLQVVFTVALSSPNIR